MQQEIEILYGRGTLGVRLPEGARPTVIRKSALPKIDDQQEAVRRALAEPVGCAPLADLARGRASACIVICDITRPVPNRLFLRPLIETMVESGIPLEGITVLVACGLHRAGDDAEMAELIGDEWVGRHVRTIWHDARDDDALVDLGPTPTRGTPVVLNRAFVEADLRVATGLVEPHFMAGWSGGRKVVAPGVAGQATIRTFHSARFMEDPAAVQCNLVGNPLHEEQLQIVAKLGEVYALNTVIDEERDLNFVNFGEIDQSHLEAVEVVRRVAQVPVGRRFPVVVTSAAGYPLDKTYYQTVKGMVTPMDIVEPGGTILIASACSEGFGSAEFREAQRRLVSLGTDGFLASIVDEPLARIDEWQTEMQLKPMRRGSIELFTDGLDADERADTAVTCVDDLDAAVAAAMARAGSPEVAVIPEGPYLIPVAAPGAEGGDAGVHGSD